MRYLVGALVLLAASVAAAQTIPRELVGKWTIRRVIPTRTISCWAGIEAKGIIGSEVEYTPHSFRWNRVIVRHPRVEVRSVSAEQFERENSSPSANGSQVSFRQLGIAVPETKQINIDHEPAQITRATAEIPGDLVWIKSRNTIVLSVCNVYFEAKRLPAQKKTIAGASGR